MKRLLLTFLLFVAAFYAMEWVDLAILVVGVALGMACMAFLHILATPDSAS